MHVDGQSINLARTADLYGFLMANHGEMFRPCGNSIYMKTNRSLYIKAGFYGYRDFGNGETGNGIDLLTRHLGYSFQEAVKALCGRGVSTGAARREAVPADPKQISLPAAAPPPHRRMFAYLLKRSIPGSIISRLVSERLIYQEEKTGNIVFVNKERDYCELRGTFTYTESPFHGCRKARPGRFWYFRPKAGRPDTAFVTESAIDAISLWLLRHDEEKSCIPMYISIGGVSNYSAIDRIRRKIKTVIAVDNDPAGDICRSHYADLESLIPKRKDWNEDLQAHV